MVRNGIGFSVDVSDKWDDALQRMRRLLRIHPDGGLPGSEGCVAILEHVKECRDYLAQVISSTGAATGLEVMYIQDRKALSLCTDYGCFVWSSRP